MRTLGRALAAVAMLSPAAAAAVYRVEVSEESFTPTARDLASVGSVVPVTCVWVATDDLASARTMAAQFGLTAQHACVSGHRTCSVGWLATGPDDEPVSLRVEGYGLSDQVT